MFTDCPELLEERVVCPEERESALSLVNGSPSAPDIEQRREAALQKGKLIKGAIQGTLRYDPISRRRPPDNFRFQYWPWQFPDKIDFQPLSSTLCRSKISGSADYGKSRGE